jgi:hypothetical protein
MIGALTGWKLLYPEVSEYRQYISYMRTNDCGSERLEIALSRGQGVQTVHFFYED